MKKKKNGLYKRLRSARLARGYSQEELADRSGVSADAIRKIEAQKIKNPRQLEKIARALDVSPAWLQYGMEEIDDLDQDAIEVALKYNELTDEQKEIVKNVIAAIPKK